MTQSIAERIAGLPKMPKGKRYNALHARLSVAQDAIDAYLKAVDTRRNADEWVHNQVRITELENAAIAAEADLRLVRDMK